jgi:metal-responsive CopG/Arc/MetJ family transcriptional regulator
MEKPTLRITPKKYVGETTIISMSMSKELLKDIDSVAAVTGRNRNEILTMSLEFALNHMEIVMKEREEA